jgi:hypothetical protein
MTFKIVWIPYFLNKSYQIQHEFLPSHVYFTVVFSLYFTFIMKFVLIKSKTEVSNSGYLGNSLDYYIYIICVFEVIQAYIPRPKLSPVKCSLLSVEQFEIAEYWLEVEFNVVEGGVDNFVVVR